MKTLALLILLAPLATAQVGKSFAQTCARYNASSTDALLVTKLTGAGYSMEVLKDGTVDVLTYLKSNREPMTLVEVKKLMSDNITAGAWEKTGPRTWKHAKERKSAFYSDEECRLYFWMDFAASKDSMDRHVETLLEISPGCITEDDMSRFRRIQATICKP